MSGVAGPGFEHRPLPGARLDTVAGFTRSLAALRRVGNTDGAIALVEGLFADGTPNGLSAAVGEELFRTVALDPTVPPALFRHMAERFGWRDQASPAAADDADWHREVLARVAAEDWFAELTAAAQSGNPVAAAVLARSAAKPTPPVLDDAQKRQARAVMDQLLQRGHFLLDRLDARSLAALRDAVHGPITAANSVLKRPSFLPRPVERWRQRLGWSGQLVILVFLVAVAMALWSP